jgi:transitional endoplasmic reticulum ATPase
VLKITENKLKVQKANRRDIGRNLIRIEESFMKKLDIKTGDIIEIIGKKQSAGIAWPGYPQDDGLGIIRIDARLQKNTGTKIGDTVEIHKIETKVAQSVVLTPINIRIRNNPRFESFTKRKLNNIPITLEDYIDMSLGISRDITFKVVSLIPEGICVIKSETVLHINEFEINESETNVQSYDDIGGLEHQINELKYILDLRSTHSSIVNRLNIEMPKGILFEGPPGTGKTLLARIIANDINFHFISMIAPEIITKYQGESENS